MIARVVTRFFTPKGLAVACALCIALGTYGGWTANGWRLNARIDRIQSTHAAALVIAENRARKLEREAREASDKADKQAVEIQERIKVETRTIIKEVPVYVTPETDTRYALPVGLVRVHDDAATGRVSSLSDAASEPDEAAHFAEPSPVRASEFAVVIAENYGTCRADQARLLGLQNWLLTQRDIYEAR